MAFSFELKTRKEAETIETFLKTEMEDFTVFGSREYLDAEMVAKALLPEEQLDTRKYADYFRVGISLFARVVNVIKAVWPAKYETRYGVSYTPKERIVRDPQCEIDAGGSLQRRPLEVQFGLDCKDIEEDDARAMGIVAPSPSSVIAGMRKDLAFQKCRARTLQMKLNAAQDEVKRLSKFGIADDGKPTATMPSEESSVQPAEIIVQPTEDPVPPTEDTDAPSELPRANDPNHNARSAGSVIGRDLLTNEDIVFASAERAAIACGIASGSFRKSYLDRPRQLRGKVWRRPGKPVWIPPRGLVYDPEATTPMDRGYVEFRNVDTGEATLYESIAAAENHMHTSIPRKTMSGYVDRNVPMHLKDGSSVTIRILPVEQYSDWRSETENVASATEVIPAVCSNRRLHGPVIARHIESGREQAFANTHDAAKEFSIDAECLAVSVVDTTCQIQGWTFRRPDSVRFWIPPATFRYDATLKKPAKGAKMVVAFRKDGAEHVTDLYESILYASKCTGVDKSTLGASVGKDKMRADRYWRAATEADVRGSSGGT